jgi:hypothetical protein
MSIQFPSTLTNDELIAEMNRFARCERNDVASLIAHIAEFDERKLHLALGYSSLFLYCCEVLKLSTGEAYRRIEVARYARKYPMILDKLADGSVNLTTVDLIAPVLKPTNYPEVLAEASGKSKREVQKQVAALAPQPDVPLTITPLPLGASPQDTRSSFKPLSPGRERVCFTMDTSTIEKLNRAKDLLSHALPPGDCYGEIIDRAMTLLLADLDKKRCGKTDRPRPCRPPTPGSPYIPKDIKRAVWKRDGSRCTFVGKTGRRCAETSYLQEHHIVPRALGGPTSVENLTLRCGPHNRYDAAQAFGPRYAGMVSEKRASYRAGVATRAGASSRIADTHINKVALVTPAQLSQRPGKATRPPARRPGTPPEGCPRARPASSASCLPSASRAASACA